MQGGASPASVPPRPLLLLACLLAGTPAAASPKGNKSEGWRLPHHSFDRTLTYDDTLGDWLASAGSIPLRDRLQLVPPVPDRYGMFWNKKPVKTKDFEVRFTISASDGGIVQQGPVDGAFTFWLSPDNVAQQYNEQSVVTTPSKVWSDGLKNIGYTLLSNKPDFRGLALTFVDNGNPTIGAIWNDGSKSRTLADLTSPASGAQTKGIHWMTGGTQVKVRVTPDGAVNASVMTLDLRSHLAGSLWSFTHDGVNKDGMIGFQADTKVTLNDKAVEGSWAILPGNKLKLSLEGKEYIARFEGSTRAVVEEPKTVPQAVLLYGGQDTGDNAGDWTEICSLPADTVAANEAYMGFSGYTGTRTFFEVNMHRLETVNFDEKVMGEEDADIFGDKHKEWIAVLEKEKRYVDQASQAEAVLRLTQMLSSHVEKISKDGDALKSTLMGLENRLDNMGTDMASYLSATKAFSFDTDKFEPTSITGHIKSITSILTSAQETHRTNMDGLNQAAKGLKETAPGSLSPSGRHKVTLVKDQAKDVELFAAAGSSQTNYMLFFIVLVVAGLGLLFLHRMQYYERKHYM